MNTDQMRELLRKRTRSGPAPAEIAQMMAEQNAPKPLPRSKDIVPLHVEIVSGLQTSLDACVNLMPHVLDLGRLDALQEVLQVTSALRSILEAVSSQGTAMSLAPHPTEGKSRIISPPNAGEVTV